MTTISNEYNIGDRVQVVPYIGVPQEWVGMRGTVKRWTYTRKTAGDDHDAADILYHVLLDDGMMEVFAAAALQTDGLMDAYHEVRVEGNSAGAWALKSMYTSVCDDYIAVFANKNDYEFDGWVGDIVGGMACFGDYCFSFDDIRLDVDKQTPAGELLRYTDAYAECNYRTWLRKRKNGSNR